MAIRTHKVYVIFYEVTESTGEKKWIEHSRTSNKMSSMKTFGDLQKVDANVRVEERYY